MIPWPVFPAPLLSSVPPPFSISLPSPTLPPLSHFLAGSCWAFAAVGAVEGINQIVTRKLVTLSSQQLIDCNHWSDGCNGGTPRSALQYIVVSGGINADGDYRYSSQSGQVTGPCRANHVCSTYYVVTPVTWLT